MDGTLSEIKNQLQVMLDATEDKTSIANITTLGNLVDRMDAEHKKLQDEYKEMFSDYKELIKHTSFVPNGTEQSEVNEQKDLTFDTFLCDYIKQKKDV